MTRISACAVGSFSSRVLFARAGQDCPILDQNGTDRHFAARGSVMRFGKGHTHRVSFLVHAVLIVYRTVIKGSLRIYSQENLIAGSERC